MRDRGEEGLRYITSCGCKAGRMPAALIPLSISSLFYYRALEAVISWKMTTGDLRPTWILEKLTRLIGLGDIAVQTRGAPPTLLSNRNKSPLADIVEIEAAVTNRECVAEADRKRPQRPNE
eukprot:GHVU01142841.1.p1 GENE.GHVU01142841.1~~GHVU01142841.1.p1  ORF type:complete len:121 (-),score=3.58 GHVU01142841.1:151-513(-)